MERGYSFYVEGRLYDAVRECIISEGLFDIPEIFTTETGQIIQPVGFASETWRYCTNETAFENGWIPGGCGGAYRRLDERLYQFLTASGSLLILREYEIGCPMGVFKCEVFIDRKELLEMGSI